MSQSNGDPVMYGLYAVLVHSGYSCHAGHYYCYVKVGGVWVRVWLVRWQWVPCLLGAGLQCLFAQVRMWAPQNTCSVGNGVFCCVRVSCFGAWSAEVSLKPTLVGSIQTLPGDPGGCF